VDATTVYWGRGATSTTTGNVARRRIDRSNSALSFASGEPGTGLTVAGGQLYWMSNGNVRTCPAPDCSGGPSNFALSGGTQNGDVLVASGNNRVYFAQPSQYNSSNGALWYAPLLGGAPQKIAAAPTNPHRLTTDGTNLYWTNSSTYTSDSQNVDAKVLKMTLAGASLVNLAESFRGDIGAIAVGGGNVYFAGRPYLSGNYVSGIFRVPLPNGVGSAAPPIFADDLSVTGIVTDSNYVYFTADNSVYRCRHSSCATPPEIIAPNQDSASAIAQDAVSIYWTTYGTPGMATTQTVMRLAK
jgi:hypothetical protein